MNRNLCSVRGFHISSDVFYRGLLVIHFIFTVILRNLFICTRKYLVSFSEFNFSGLPIYRPDVKKLYEVIVCPPIHCFMLHTSKSVAACIAKPESLPKVANIVIVFRLTFITIQEKLDQVVFLLCHGDTSSFTPSHSHCVYCAFNSLPLFQSLMK